MVDCWRTDYSWFGLNRLGVVLVQTLEGRCHTSRKYVCRSSSGSVTLNIAQHAATHHAGKNHGVVHLHGRSCSLLMSTVCLRDAVSTVVGPLAQGGIQILGDVPQFQECCGFVVKCFVS